jgi:hypothetical protein
MFRVFAGWLYFWGLLALVIGAVLYVLHRPDVPAKEDLVEYTGFLIAVGLQKDFDGTDIVLLRFKDNDQVYKYISVYPKYVDVRDRIGIYRDTTVWYDKNATGGPDKPILVWALKEHDPRGEEESTFVTYEEIYDEVTETDRSYQQLGMVVGGAGLALIVLGFVIRKAVPYKPRAPRV